MNKLDWGKIDFSALLSSQVVRGNIVTIICTIAAITGHNLPDSMQSQLTDLVTQLLTLAATISAVYSTYHRATAQAGDATTIVPQKPTPTGDTK